MTEIDIFECSERNNLKGTKSYTGDVNVKEDGKWSLLHDNIYYDNYEIAKYLVTERGADVNILNQFDETTLQFAIQHSTLDTVKLLVENGADITKIGNNQGIPYVFYAYKYKKEKFDYLLHKISDINMLDNNGKTLLWNACNDNDIETIKMLMDMGANRINFEEFKPEVKELLLTY